MNEKKKLFEHMRMRQNVTARQNTPTTRRRKQRMQKNNDDYTITYDEYG